MVEPSRHGRRPTGKLEINGEPWSRVVDRIVEFGKSLVRALTDSYRPELHYMRGPGPKWRAKHGPA
jgi:hypothetical protein